MHISDSMIHKDLRQAGRVLRKILPQFTERTFKMADFFLKSIRGRCRSDLQFEEVYLQRSDGSHLRLCVYSPRIAKADVPGLLWIHGGGYAMGIPEMDEAVIRQFIGVSGCVVVSPDYRKSPDAPYPAALEDSYNALLWLKEHGPRYNMREDQIMVGGSSAGGGLTAALSLYARDRGEVAIAFQMPLYPMIDDRMTTASARDNDAPVWNAKSNETAWKLYLGDLYKSHRVPAYAAPARAQDLAGLPPACTFVGSIEPFRDETVTYIKGLRASGVPVGFREFPGCFHGFDIVCPGAEISGEARRFLMECFSHASGHYFAAQLDQKDFTSDGMSPREYPG